MTSDLPPPHKWLKILLSGLVVILRRYIAIYIAQACTFSYVDFQYEPKLVLYALYACRNNGLNVGASNEVIFVSSHSVQPYDTWSIIYFLLLLLRLLFVTDADTVAFAFIASAAAVNLVDCHLGCGRDAKLTLLLLPLES